MPVLRNQRGRGVSTKTGLWNQEVYYLLAEFDSGFGGVFRSNYRLGGGIRAGALVDVSTSWRLHLEGAVLDYAAGDRRGRFQAVVEQVSTFSKNKDARLILSRSGSYEQAVVAANLYF